MAETLQIFVSFSHKDKPLKNKLETHLSVLARTHNANLWSDKQIVAGEEWNDKIFSSLSESNIILLLISPNFIASDFCYKREMPQAMLMHQKLLAVVVPILLEPVDCANMPFNKLQGLPAEQRFVTLWKNQDEAFVDIITGLKKSIEGLVKDLKNRSPSERRSEIEKYMEDGNLTFACSRLMDFACDFSTDNDHKVKARILKNKETLIQIEKKTIGDENSKTKFPEILKAQGELMNEMFELLDDISETLYRKVI